MNRNLDLRLVSDLNQRKGCVEGHPPVIREEPKNLTLAMT